MSIQYNGIQPGRRASNLHQVTQDFLHLARVGDDGKNAHWGGAAGTDQRIDLVDSGDQSRPCRTAGGLRDGGGGGLREGFGVNHPLGFLPPPRGMADDMIPLGPLPTAAGRVQPEVVVMLRVT